MPSDNQTPEQAARDKIDEQLSNAGWIVQDNKKIDFSAGLGIAVREYQTVIVIDECHRSIYNLWRQVLEYFDAYLIGLTATPDNRTYGFFKKNIVSEYTHEQAVADGVNRARPCRRN